MLVFENYHHYNLQIYQIYFYYTDIFHDNYYSLLLNFRYNNYQIHLVNFPCIISKYKILELEILCIKEKIHIASISLINIYKINFG